MIHEMMKQFPGIGCAWVNAAGAEKAEYYGLADREKGIPVDENTVFPVSSMSKFVTAFCVMKFHEQQLIHIDEPVNTYLKQWKLRTLSGGESEATGRALLSHTAGIVDGEDGFYGLRRGDPEISLVDILEGRTFYNRRPVRSEKPWGTTFEYSDGGYCVLQLLVEEVTGLAFWDAVRENVFDRLNLSSTFYGLPENPEHNGHLAIGYDGNGEPLPGGFLPCPDLAGAGLWTTPREMLAIGREFVAALQGKSEFLREKSAREMAKPVDQFPWAGLGVFISGEDVLMTQGWGENGQSMMKMDCRTGRVSVVMTNRNPETEQSESGVEWLVDRNMNS